MNVGDLPAAEFAARLAADGVAVEIPPFVASVRSDLASVANGLRLFYTDYRVADEGFADFHVRLARPASVRRWLRPQVNFLFDGVQPFKPLPLDQAYPMFEWGLNWCIANHCHEYVILHAAVVERGGRAALLPAPPGSGKSTLTAALVSRGWRLLSDELALISPARLDLAPLPRPISLKNESIDVIRAFEPSALVGPVSRDTHKGSVAHVRAPAESIRRAREASHPAWIVFPRYERDASPRAGDVSRAHTVLKLAENAFNFSLLGEVAFDCLVRTVDRCVCLDFTYSRLDDAVAFFDALPPARA